MNKFRIVKGDLLLMAEAGQFDAIAHGCNCYNAMAAGIAHSIANKWPQVQAADNATTKGDKSKMGSFSKESVPNIRGEFFTVYNLYTQHKPGPDARYFMLRTSLEAMITELIEEVLRLRKQNQIDTQDGPTPIEIGLPYIGAGIGGLDAKQVESHIVDILKRPMIIRDDVEVCITLVDYLKTSPENHIIAVALDDQRDFKQIEHRLMSLNEVEVLQQVLYANSLLATLRSGTKFKEWIEQSWQHHIWPNVLFLDHDLIPEHYPGGKESFGSFNAYDEYQEDSDKWTGLNALNWLSEFAAMNKLMMPTVIPITQNPMGMANIYTTLDAFNKYQAYDEIIE